MGQSIMKKVLDKGYVRLVNTMGSDLTVVNAARCSFDRESKELNSKDERLINFLIREGHTSPFRHANMQFEIYSPLMMARQHWKHIVGSDHTMDSWNESSRRYVTEVPEFYIPGPAEWRGAPENSKQGSGSNLPEKQGANWSQTMEAHAEYCENLYNRALAEGICAEQARLFLPAYGLYIRYYWSASLQSVLHFLDQRLESDAQKEIQVYAEAVEAFVIEEFPAVHEAWRKANVSNAK